MTAEEAIVDIVKTYDRKSRWAEGVQACSVEIGETETAKQFETLAIRHKAVADFICLEMKRLAGIDIP